MFAGTHIAGRMDSAFCASVVGKAIKSEFHTHALATMLGRNNKRRSNNK